MKTLSLPLSPVGQHPASFLQLNPRRSNRQAAGEQRDDSIALARWALQELLTANLHHSCTRITLKKKLTEMTTYFNLYKFTTPFLYISWFIIFFYMSHCEPTTYCPTTWDDFSFSLNRDTKTPHIITIIILKCFSSSGSLLRAQTADLRYITSLH